MELAWNIAVVVCGVLFVCFLFVIAFGAPYLPTLKPQVSTAFELLKLQPGQTLLELGSGDGRILKAAARQGIRAIGYELNPLLVVYSWLTTLRYRKLVKVRWANYWRGTLPPADAIFVFLLQPYMQKLDTKIIQDYQQNYRGRSLKLVSFAFHIPGKKPTRQQKGLFLYTYK